MVDSCGVCQSVAAVGSAREVVAMATYLSNVLRVGNARQYHSIFKLFEDEYWFRKYSRPTS